MHHEAVIGYRDAAPDDMRFVRHSWVESYRTSHYAGPIPMRDYFRIYHDVVKRLVAREDSHVMVAFNPQYESQIFGFVAYERGFSLPLVNYIYVKEDFRELPTKDSTFKEGLATMLLREINIDPKKPFYYTFKTGAWAWLTKRSGPFSGGVFQPLLARFEKREAVEHEKQETPKKRDRKCA
tara:strand:+ start:895 stop:1437 length:543 start_codon:yes stop_codon:yes gene_type:complete